MSDLHIAKVVITLANLVNSKKGFVNVQAANSNHEKWSSNKPSLPITSLAFAAIASELQFCMGPILKTGDDQVWRLK